MPKVYPIDGVFRPTNISKIIILNKNQLLPKAYHFGKKDFELGFGGEGQDTSRHFEGRFGYIHAILPM